MSTAMASRLNNKKETAAEASAPANETKKEPAQEPFSPLQLTDWLRSVPAIPPEQTCGQVVDLFRRRTDLECLVVADEQRRPIGLVMKHRFFRSLGSQFGNALFGYKSIVRLMDSRFLAAETDTTTQELIDLALTRDEETLYDAVILIEKSRFAGIVTIGDLLGMSRLLQREASDRQIRTVRGTESMIGRIAEAVERVSETAESSRRSGERIAEVAEHGREELERMLALYRLWNETAMRQETAARDLLERSNEAMGITQLIAGLADTCNLLAMNAQIEAARAGEHGRSFGIVAEEVRALADQTKQSAERINRQLRGMAEAADSAARAVREGKSGSDEGVRRVREAEATFGRLWELSEGNREASRRLAEASNEAGEVTQQIRLQMAKLAAQLLGGSKP